MTTHAPRSRRNNNYRPVPDEVLAAKHKLLREGKLLPESPSEVALCPIHVRTLYHAQNKVWERRA